jgi:hypothetical protein
VSGIAFAREGVAAGAPRSLSRRVLYLRDDDYPWDVRAEKICRALTDAGHEVHIVARNREGRASVERLAEGVVHRMPPLPLAPRALDVATGFPAFFNPRWIALICSVDVFSRV